MLRRILLPAVAMLGAAWATAWAAEAPAASNAIVLKAARLFDGSSDRAVSPGEMLVENGKIVRLGPGAVPPGARVVDLGNATLLPGFIDAHTHLSFEGSANWYRDFYDGVMRF